LSLVALGAIAVIVFSACQGAPASPTPGGGSPTAAGTSAPPTVAVSQKPFEAGSYPTEGEVDCEGKIFNNLEYKGNFKKISADTEDTVVFELCSPDVAFLSKIAFTSFAINDSAYLESAGPGIISAANGTGPFKLKEWQRTDHITLERNDQYWGDKALVPTAIFRWSTEGAQRLVELQSATVDGIDNPSPDDFATIEGDSSLKLYPRTALNVFYIGFNNTLNASKAPKANPPFDNEKVRQAIAMGIDRQRIVDNFYPEGSEVATHFTPCVIPNGCEGDPWYEFDATAAKALLDEGLAEAGMPTGGFSTKLHYRDVFRGYLPEPNLVAQDIQAQLKANLNIDAQIDVQDSTKYIDNADAGSLNGIHLLGWGADYPDMTNFVDFHFGGGASDQFGKKFEDIVAVLADAASKPSDEERKPLYAEANNLIRQHVPMIPVAHGASATAFRADVEGAHSSPLGNESLAVMKPGDRNQIVWMQNAEPGGIYCADETDGESLRVCEQLNESLYAYETGGTAVQPSLAESCEPNAELTVWTCKLRAGVTFHNGATLDARDVVDTYAVQWDQANPLRIGRTGSFTYFSALFGGFLNTPPAAPEG
jgi:ABC-type transport system substrate-binding protein